MKNIDQMIRSAKVTTRRVAVVDQVMQKVSKKRRAFVPAQAWGLAILVVAGFVPLGVTAANALVHGYWDDYMSVVQQTDKTVQLPNGNRVITFDASWCGTYGVASSFDAAKTDKKITREYYEIQKDAGVSDQDVINWRKTNCEASLVGSELQKISDSLHAPEGTVILATQFVTVKSADESYLDIYPPSFHQAAWTNPDGVKQEAYDSPEVHYVFHQPLEQTKILDIPQVQRKITDLNPGDTVMVFIAVDKSVSPYCNSKQTVLGDSPCDLSLFPRQNPGTIVAIVRTPAYTSDLNSPVQLGKNVFTVVPCKTSMNGLCASGEMNQQGQYPNPTPLMAWPIAQAVIAVGVLVVTGCIVFWRKRLAK